MPAEEEGKRELRAQVCAAATPTPAGPFGMGLGRQACDRPAVASLSTGLWEQQQRMDGASAA